MLPKSEHVSYVLTIPSTKAKVSFRPILVKDEKILLTAKQSGDEADILFSIQQVVINCALQPLDIKALTLFDLEYLFLKMRAKSVDNISTVNIKDEEDGKWYSFPVNLDQVEVKFPENSEVVNNTIKVNDQVTIELSYPMATLYKDKDFLKSEQHNVFENLFYKCVNAIYKGETAYKNFSSTDITEFYENLSIPVKHSIEQFFLDAPKLDYTIEYKNAMGQDKVHVLSSLDDFFILR